jgi:hypothetical protein
LTLFKPADTDETASRAPKEKDTNDDFIVIMCVAGPASRNGKEDDEANARR